MDTLDNELIRQYLDGDQIALEKLIERYMHSIYNYAYRMSGNKGDAEDVTQEIFLKVWKKIASYKEQSSFKTWLFTIARNTLIDWSRKKKSIVFSDMEKDSEENTFEDTIPDHELTQEEHFIQKQDTLLLTEALAEIPNSYREILLLHINEEMTFKDIGIMLAKSTNTVKSQYRRALTQLRKILQEK